MNDKLCQLMGIQCCVASAYHPQTNGLDERFNQTLQRQLLKFVEEEQTDWDLFIDTILFSYRVSPQDSTKVSPFSLVYGRQARLPVELQDLPFEGEEDPLIEPSQVEPDFSLDERTERMIRIRKEALENIAKAQSRQKKYYDAKHCKDKAQYKVGSLVLLLNSKKHSKKGLKMAPNWTGPYAIHEVLSKGTFKLCEVKNTKKVTTQKYNMTRLKLYFQREVQSGQGSPFQPQSVAPGKSQVKYLSMPVHCTLCMLQNVF